MLTAVSGDEQLSFYREEFVERNEGKDRLLRSEIWTEVENEQNK